MSMFDDMNQMVTDAIIQEVSEQLFEDWNNANLDEGELYADYQILSLAGTPELYKRFNEHYELNPGDEYYMEVE